MLAVQDLLLLNPPARKFTFVQKAWNSTAGNTPSPTTTTVALPSVGAGHLVVVSVDYLGTATGFTITIDDGNGNSFTLTPNSPFKYNALAPMVWLGYILSAAAGSMTVTVTLSVAHGVSVHVAEFSYSGTCSFDADAGAFATTGTTPINTPSLTPGAANVLLYATAIADPAGSGSFLGAVDGWIDGNIGVIASDNNNSADAYILVESGTKKVNWATQFSTNTGWVAGIMSFKVTVTAGAMTGVSFGSSTSSSALTGAGQLVGAVVAAAASASVLAGAGSLIGVSAGTPTTSATSSGSGALQGSATSTLASAAVISGQGALQGSASVVLSSAAVLVGQGALQGISVEVLGSTAALLNAAALPIFATGFSFGFGLLTGIGGLAGFASAGSSSTATIAASGRLQGNAMSASIASATIEGRGALIGNSVSLLATLAILIDQGFVDFFVANAFAVAAVNLSMLTVPAVDISLKIASIGIDLEVTH